MLRRFGISLILVGALALAASAQEPTHYTFVAEWAIERNQWQEFTTHFEKNVRPTLERLMADGTINGWGAFEAIVHQPNETTHGTWWTATSIANLERARGELIKIPPSPSMANAKIHRDYLLRSLMRTARATAAASGYLWVSSSMVKPGQGQAWRENFEKYNKPTYDQLSSGGTVTYFAVDVEQVHTEDSGLRFVVYISPGVDGPDKVSATFGAVAQKRSAEERRAIAETFANLTVPGTHRDFFARVISYAQK